jgi:ribonuclease III
MHKLLEFKNEKLLIQALTHRSYVNESSEVIEDNERLEFLGDAILNFLSGDYLYHHGNNMNEEEMTRRRAALVDEKQLARFADQTGVGVRMKLGQGAMRDGGYGNPNLLSSTFEAVIGAYYLDNDCNIKVLRPLVEDLFNSVPEDLITVRSNVDSKNRFQQWVQANICSNPPNYITEKVSGTPDHSPEFISKVYVNNKIYGEGKGKNKKEAEKDAAKNALIFIKLSS